MKTLNKWLWVCLIFVLAMPLTGQTQVAHLDPSTMANQTKLDVVEVKISNGRIQLSLRNTYAKTINVLVLSLSPELKITEQFFHDERVIRPNSTYVFDADLPSGKLEVHIRAILFEDKSADGDPVFIEEVRQSRAGRKLLFQQALSLFTETSLIEDITQAVSDLAPDPEMPFRVRLGFQDGKKEILGMLNQLIMNQLNIAEQDYLKKGLSRLKDHYQQKVIPKL